MNNINNKLGTIFIICVLVFSTIIISLETAKASPTILLVEDDGSSTYVSEYQQALNDAGYIYDNWDTSISGTPSLATLAGYDVVIWFTATTATTLNSAEEANLAAYLDGGGKLLICGQELGFDLGSSGVGESAGFIRDYLHADYIRDDSGGTSLDGVTGDPITDGYAGLPMLVGSYPDGIEPYDAAASTIFTYANGGYPGSPAGIKADAGTFRVVYISCCYFEDMNNDIEAAEIMDKIIIWLAYGPPVITHIPLPDTEDIAGPYTVIATITDDALTDTNIYYDVGSGWVGPIGMTPTANPDEFSANIPGQSWGTTVNYYIEAIDTDFITTTDPDGAPTSYHSFLVEEDSAPPVITHTPLSDQGGTSPYEIIAVITDNAAGVDISATFVYYSVDGGAWIPVAMSATGSPDEFNASIPCQSPGSVIDYYIEATDLASTPNTDTHPPWPPFDYHTFTSLDKTHILIVDDDSNSYESYYTAALDALPYSYHLGDPSYDFSMYHMIIWFCDDTGALQGADITKLENYLDAGGNVYMSVEEFGYSHGSEPLYTDYFGLSYVDYGGSNSLIDGIALDEISDDWSALSLNINGGDGAMNSDYADEFTSNGADMIFSNQEPNWVGSKYDTGTYKTVHTSFQFEAVSSAAERLLLMQRIVDWLIGGPPTITHTPHPDTADEIGPYAITATITDTNLDTSELYVYYRTGGSWNQVPMTNVAGDAYTANIPGQSWGTTVDYYIEATDLSLDVSTDPAGAPASYHSFLVDQDSIPPTIVHTSITDQAGVGPYPVIAVITDNIGLVTTEMYYRLNGGSWNQVPMTPTANPNEFSADIPDMPIGTQIDYYIEAMDTAPNMAYDPAGAPAIYHTFYRVALSQEIMFINFCQSTAGSLNDQMQFSTGWTMLNSSYPITWWNVSTMGAPDLTNYGVVVIDSGVSGGYNLLDNWDETSGSEVTDDLATFLDAGGGLYTYGYDLSYWLNWSGTPESLAFCDDYLQIGHRGNHATLYDNIVEGEIGDPITDGIGTVSMNPRNDDVDWWYVDEAGQNSIAIFQNDPADPTQDNCGARYDSTIYRTVCTPWAIGEYGTPAERDFLMQRILDWLLPPVPSDDVMVASIDSHEDGQTYYNGAQDIDATIANIGLDPEPSFDARCVINRVMVDEVFNYVYLEDFESPANWDLDNQPTGWTIYDDNADGKDLSDWHQAYIDPIGNVASIGVAFPEEVPPHQDRLISDNISIPVATGNQKIYLDFQHWFSDYSSDIKVDLSLDGGVTWPGWIEDSDPRRVKRYMNIDSEGLEHIDVTSLVSGVSNVQIRFWYYAGGPSLRVDNVSFYVYTPEVLSEVYNETRVVPALDTGNNAQLTWNFDFLPADDYYINISTELAVDDEPRNDYLEIKVIMVDPPANDVAVDSIDSHIDDGNYLSGSQDIIATVSNVGSNSQGPFNVGCEIYLGAPFVHFSDDMESGAGGWTQTSTTSTQWALGTPPVSQADPQFHSASNCWGTDLNNDYVDLTDAALTSPHIDLTLATDANLTFWYYLDVQGPADLDGGIVEINYGSGWEQLDPTNSQGQYDAIIVGSPSSIEDLWAICDTSGGWVQKTFSLDAYCGYDTQIRFRFGSDDWTGTNSGWFIDDVEVYSNIFYDNLVFSQSQPTLGTMDRFDTQQITWNYDFPIDGHYRIYTYTQLPGDEDLSNDEKFVDITIAGGIGTVQYNISVNLGWNFISFPIMATGAVDIVLDDSAGDGLTTWDCVKWYNVQDAADPWKTYRTGMSNNDLTGLNNAMGLWVQITNLGDGFLTVEGILPVSTNIQLYTGWNLVGYPSATGVKASVTLPGDADMIAIYDAAEPYLIKDVTNLNGPDSNMDPGNAYWVHVTADCVWNVNW